MDSLKEKALGQCRARTQGMKKGLAGQVEMNAVKIVLAGWIIDSKTI